MRLGYRGPFPYPLSAYLNPINWALWERQEDTPRLIAELMQAISGGKLPIDEQSKADLIGISKPPPLPPPSPFAPLEIPGGTVDPQSVFYMNRPGDQTARETIGRQGATIVIKGPRQMGKSSLLMRALEAAKEAGKRVAFLDFQLFDHAALRDANLFFRQFCFLISDELDMGNRVASYWDMPVGNRLRCTRYMGRYLLTELASPLLLAMDEVESVFDADFRSDFFGMLRSWHNNRATTPIWKQLDIVLVTSTEPYLFIEDPNESPFNVGEVIDLTDFNLDQVTDLNRRHGSPLTPNQEQELLGLLGGHPYLVRRALYLVASQQISSTELFTHATQDRGPFGDHLRYYLFRLRGREDLIQGLRQVIRYSTCQDEMVSYRLQSAGLVRREGQAVLPRCQLYADYFRAHLHV